jgi:hypothetical protein
LNAWSVFPETAKGAWFAQAIHVLHEVDTRFEMARLELTAAFTKDLLRTERRLYPSSPSKIQTSIL